MSFIKLILLMACVFTLPDRFANADPSAPDPIMLAQEAKATRARLLTDPVNWKTTIAFSGTAISMEAEWVMSSAGARVDFTAHVNKYSEHLATVIERDGFWYVSEGKRYGKYRPYEAPFTNATLPFYYQLSLPRPAQFGAQTQFDGLDNDIASYRTPVGEPMRSQLNSMLREFDAAGGAAKMGTPEVNKNIAMVRDMLANGISTRVNVKSGFAAEMVNPRMSIRWSALNWMQQPDANAIDLAGHDWPDHTTCAMTADPNDLVMMNHNGAWTPGGRSDGDSDARIVNIKTGEIWRVPFQGGIGLAGCFCRDRQWVIISAADADSGGLTLYKVDLRTGENQRFGDSGVSQGINIMPAISHDGRTVAVLHKGATEKMLEPQVCLIDLATGKSHPLGKAMDTAYLSWLPDDSGLVLLRRRAAPLDQIPETDIVRMDLQGPVSLICAGDSPLVLPSGRILFESQTTGIREWETCRLDGSDATKLGDGLQHYGFPTASPDGHHLLMMHFSGNRQVPPVPTIMDIDGSHLQPLQVSPGLWSMPCW